MTDFKALLRNPPEAARGMTRWWWYGCAVEEKEIDRELNLMKEAGIGGVELQILYPLHRDNREKGVQNVPYFSPRFFELTGYAAHRCRELGLRFDFTPGSSWPYGGPPITQEYAMHRGRVRTRTILPRSLPARFVPRLSVRWKTAGCCPKRCGM